MLTAADSFLESLAKCFFIFSVILLEPHINSTTSQYKGNCLDHITPIPYSASEITRRRGAVGFALPRVLTAGSGRGDSPAIADHWPGRGREGSFHIRVGGDGCGRGGEREVSTSL